MTRGASLLAVAAIAAVVWLLAAPLAWPARAVVVLIVAGLPPLAMLQARDLDELPPESARLPLYLLSIASLWILAALAFVAARASAMDARTLGLIIADRRTLVAWSALTLAGGFAIVAAFRIAGGREKRILRYLIPRTPVEVMGFLALSATAGVTEELVFRGFLVPALAQATGSPWGAAVLAAGLFGVLHAYQGALGALRAALLGVVLTLPLLFAGTIVPSIVAHALLDALAGTVFSGWLTQEHLYPGG